MEPVQIPPSALSPEALNGLMEEFISREGTDYGEGEHLMADKRAALRRQLEAGTAVIVFDPDSETANIVTADELRAHH